MQHLSGERLKALLREHSILEKIRSGKLRPVEQSTSPARIPGGGTSSIVSYYDSDTYVCTKHRIVTSSGKIRHRDVEDAFIDGVRYKKAPRLPVT